MSLLNKNNFQERYQYLDKVVHTFTKVLENDKNLSFPFENFQKLIDINYQSLSLKKADGGLDINLTEFLKYQEKIATVDASTALGIGWHMGVLGRIHDNPNWNKEVYREVIEAIKSKGALINNVASERATGSPTRGGKPETTAQRTKDGWLINGRKTYTSLAPILSYAIVTATIIESDEVAQFVVNTKLDGVSVDETWNSIAMRSTGSHDLVFENVKVRDIDYVKMTKEETSKPLAWLLHVPACYLGISRAAKDEAVNFSVNFKPAGLDHSLAELPTIEQKLGKIELLYMQSNEFLYSISRKWDESNEDERIALKPKLEAAKVIIINNGIDIVDQAMRIVGARSLAETHPLQKCYRDIRAGLHNPPMEDIVYSNLAKEMVIQYCNK